MNQEKKQEGIEGMINASGITKIFAELMNKYTELSQNINRAGHAYILCFELAKISEQLSQLESQFEDLISLAKKAAD